MSNGDEVWVMMVHELVVDVLPGINDLSVCACVCLGCHKSYSYYLCM